MFALRWIPSQIFDGATMRHLTIGFQVLIPMIPIGFCYSPKTRLQTGFQYFRAHRNPFVTAPFKDPRQTISNRYLPISVRIVPRGLTKNSDTVGLVGVVIACSKECSVNHRM